MSGDPLPPGGPPSGLPATQPFAVDGDPERIGPHSVVGPYTLLEKRGEGGMGVVYLAEQTEPVRRRVALKVIKRGMDTGEVIARFEAERQALALMDHPAIARIYDAGMTPRGRPYFAMEYVEGVPITEHCDRHSLTNRERIELFLQVCEGVQHAHQKAVIHRDLKPTNVLVSIQDGRPAAKIIDFGVAKALAHRLTERTLYTELGVLIGTPEYMSPEQAEGTRQDVDTRSDVYSLGVMLYELLVGALPFESRHLRDVGADAFRRRILEEEPPRPSVRLSSLGRRSGESARRRRTDVGVLRRELAGDLDWITMRALEKDPGRRYASPSELAEDLRRHLRFEPVLARAPSAGYRARRFVRRHRVGVAAAAVMALGLAAGTVGSTIGLVRARRAEAEARREAAAKGQVADFLKNLFRVSDPGEAQGSSVTARELLDRAADTLDTELSADPATRAEMAYLMGDVYRNLGLYAEAESLSAKALEARRRFLGPEHPDTLGSMMLLGAIYDAQGRHREAESVRSQTLEIQERVLGPEHPDTLKSRNNLAGSFLRDGRYAAAERLYSETLAIQERALGREHPDALHSTHNLAGLYLAQGRYDDAERLYTRLLAIQERALGPEHPGTLGTKASLAKVALQERRYAEAERLASQALEIQKRVLGPEHPDVLWTMTNLALAYQGQGRHAEAERLDTEVLEIQKRVLGPEHPQVLWSMNNLAFGYLNQGRYAEAERLHSQVFEIRERVLGPDHPDTLVSMYNLACVFARKGDRARAMEWLRRDIEGGDLDFEALARDPDLESLHGPEFDALVEQARRNAAAARLPEQGTEK
jgi:non-specific serine/threonine protein kinase/serine/threonine-protein kinase